MSHLDLKIVRSHHGSKKKRRPNDAPCTTTKTQEKQDAHSLTVPPTESEITFSVSHNWSGDGLSMDDVIHAIRAEHQRQSHGDDPDKEPQQLSKKRPRNYNNIGKSPNNNQVLVRFIIDPQIFRVVSETQWNQLCSELESFGTVAYIYVKTLYRAAVDIEDDRRFESILQRVGSTLRTLTLFSWHDVPHTFRQLSTLCPCLKELTIANPGKVSKGTWKRLATSIQQLHQLERLHFETLYFEEPSDAALLIEAMCHIKTLKSYQFRNCKVNGRRGPLRTFVLTPEQARQCDFYPRLNQAGYQQLLSSKEQSRLSEWIQAITAVHDREDCVFHLLNFMDPSLLALLALGNHYDIQGLDSIPTESKQII